MKRIKLLFMITTITILFSLTAYAQTSKDYIWPTDNQPMSQKYSYSSHKGIDISAPTGTTVKATKDGTVMCSSMDTAGPNEKCSNCGFEAGYHVIIKHDDGIFSFYAHLNKTIVSTGDKVSAGQKIGEVGSTGNSTGPHLHFALFKENDNNWFSLSNAVDPINYMTPFSNVYADTITNTDATLHGILGAPSMPIEKAGFYIGTSTTNMTKFLETLNLGYWHGYNEIYYNLNKYYGILTNGKTYYFQLWITQNGTEYKSNMCKFVAGTSNSSSLVNSTTNNTTTTNCKWSVKVPANYYLTCYDSATTNTASARCIKERSEGYTLSCDQKVTLPDGSVRYRFTSGDNYVLYFVYNSNKMTVTEKHSFIEKDRVEPTCISTGRVMQVCENCGYETTETLPKTKKHTKGEWIVTQEPTETSEGVRKRICSVCKLFIDTETIPALEHSHTWNSGVVYESQRCDEDGYILKTCISCGETTKESIPTKAPHIFDDGIISAKPTTTTNGTKTFTCIICGATKKEIIKKVSDIDESDNISNLSPNSKILCDTIMKATAEIDGKLDDAYTSSMQVKINPPKYGGADTDVNATVYTLYDDEFVYVFYAVENDQTLMTTDDEYIYSHPHPSCNDAVELRIGDNLEEKLPPYDGSNAAHHLFIMDAYGKRFSCYENAIGDYRQFMKGKAEIVSLTSYNVEMRIPLANCFKEGDIIQLNFQIDDLQDDFNTTGYVGLGETYMTLIDFKIGGEIKEKDRVPASTTPSLDNFKDVYTFYDNVFPDLKKSDWFWKNAKKAYSVGLMNGTGKGFDAKSNITLAQVITLAARLHSIYNSNNYDFIQGKVWYEVYVDYCIENGIIEKGEYTNFNRTATRAEFVDILYSSLPSEEFDEKNTSFTIPDVTTAHHNFDSIYQFYRAGILSGSDDAHTFYPNRNITRAESAAILTRIIDRTLRLAFK